MRESLSPPSKQEPTISNQQEYIKQPLSSFHHHYHHG